MGKKQHNSTPPNPHSVPNRDIMQRLNFLYQASSWLASLPTTTECNAVPTTEPAAPPVTSSDAKGKRKERGKVSPVTPAYLSRSYVGSMKAIGKKTVVKLDPSVKRTICKGCDTLLIPGMTATVRSRPSSSHKKSVTVSCLNCKTVRRLPAPPLSQDDSDPPAGPESTVQVDGSTGAEGKNRRKRSKKKAVYKRPFFERPEQILFRGNEAVVKSDDPISCETTEPVGVETETISKRWRVRDEIV